MDSEEMGPSTPMEVSPGVWKPFGECAAAELEASAVINDEKAEIYDRFSELGTKMAEAAHPSWDGCRCLPGRVVTLNLGSKSCANGSESSRRRRLSSTHSHG